MNKVAHYLQEHLVGEVTDAVDARRYFSTDTSIFSLTPSLIVYPRNENDVRKTARFSWQLAERGRVIPMTARGAGTNQTGAALGSGIMLVFPAHLNRILELDDKSGVVVVEPGINYGKLQQTLQTHGRFLPPYPASLEYSTVGGAVANNTSGEKSIKYGDTSKYVRGLRVVLANGEVIQTERLNKRELNKKMGLSTFEGEIYRALDKLLEEHAAALENSRPELAQNTAGYNVWDIRGKDGSFDLTPLFVGSQGTLGLITEIALSTEEHNPATLLIAASFNDIKTAEVAVSELRQLPAVPSALEIVDEHLLSYVNKQNPHFLKDVIDTPLPKAVLLIEFDNNERVQRRMLKKAKKLLEKHGATIRVETEEEGKEQLWKIRHSASQAVTRNKENARALPIIEDGIVPQDKMAEFMSKVYDLLKKYNLPMTVWGHAGTANLHTYPLLDLSQVGDRQKIFRLMDEYYDIVISMGGSTSGEHNDGRLRGAYLAKLYGNDMYELFRKIKNIFDPYEVLNPNVKVNVSLDRVRPLLRQEYDIHHLYEYLPRT